MTKTESLVARVLRPGVFEHWCEGCAKTHAIDVHAQNEDGKRLGWDGDINTPHIAETVQHRDAASLCEYELRGGYVVFTARCTHALAGKVRPLKELPKS